MPFGNRRFNCWKRHGAIDFIRAIKESCDIFFYNMGIDLGIDKIAKYARMMGLGERTGINIAGEQRGLIPDSEWKKKTYHDIWHPGETLSVAIGQGYVAATPLQLATAYAAIANGGFVYRPYVIRRIESRNGEMIKEFQPELIRKVEVPSEAFDAVKGRALSRRERSWRYGFSEPEQDYDPVGKNGYGPGPHFRRYHKVQELHGNGLPQSPPRPVHWLCAAG